MLVFFTIPLLPRFLMTMRGRHVESTYHMQKRIVNQPAGREK